MKKKAKAKEEYYRATQESVNDDYESCSDNIDLDLKVSIYVSLEHQYMYEEAMRHQRLDS